MSILLGTFQDTKWKIIKDEKDISQTDMYQLYAYGTKYQNCSKVYLIYPHNDNYLDLEYWYQIEEENKLILNILFFDLKKNLLINNIK